MIFPLRKIHFYAHFKTSFTTFLRSAEMENFLGIKNPSITKFYFDKL